MIQCAPACLLVFIFVSSYRLAFLAQQLRVAQGQTSLTHHRPQRDGGREADRGEEQRREMPWARTLLSPPHVIFSASPFSLSQARASDTQSCARQTQRAA